MKAVDAADRSLCVVSLMAFENVEASFASPPHSSISAARVSAYLAISISSSAVFFFGFQYINGFRGVPVGGAIYRKGRHGGGERGE